MSREQIEEMIKELCVDYGEKCGGCGCKPCAFIEHCKSLYNAGYRKQSVGEWVRQKGRPEAICSKCGCEVVYQVIDNKWAFENYCPHCGAKMKGEKKKEAQKKYFSPEDVRKMSPREVKANYQAIMNSMKKWN